MQHSVFIAHTYPLVREGVARVLEKDSSLILAGEAADTTNAMRGIQRLHPSVGLVEFFSGSVDGALICHTVKLKGIATKIVVMAEDVRGEDVYMAVTAGAVGYLSLRDTRKNLLKIIRGAINNDATFTQTALTVLQRYLGKRENDPHSSENFQASRPLLSQMELRVLQLIAMGVSIRSAGQVLHLSTSTIKNHRQSLYAKLGVCNAPAAVYTAVQRDILHC